MDYAEIGKKIKLKRKSLSLTQQALAEMVGLTESSISRYEAGQISTMPTSTVRRICDALHIEPSELLSLTPDKSFEYDFKELLELADGLPHSIKADLLKAFEQQIKICRRLYYGKEKDNYLLEEIED